MKLHATRAPGRNVFTGYGQGFVTVNAERFEHSIIVLPEGPVLRWNLTSIGALDEDAIRELAALKVEILLLGTGDHQRFPNMRSLQPLREAGTGIEAMDTRAACRTYNILLAEERNVAAALIV